MRVSLPLERFVPAVMVWFIAWSMIYLTVVYRTSAPEKPFDPVLFVHGFIIAFLATGLSTLVVMVLLPAAMEKDRAHRMLSVAAVIVFVLALCPATLISPDMLFHALNVAAVTGGTWYAGMWALQPSEKEKRKNA